MRVLIDPEGVAALSARERIRRQREARYLAAWPLPAQAEAHAEAAAERPEKLARMLDDLAAIRAALPYPDDNQPE